MATATFPLGVDLCVNWSTLSLGRPSRKVLGQMQNSTRFPQRLTGSWARRRPGPINIRQGFFLHDSRDSTMFLWWGSIGSPKNSLGALEARTVAVGCGGNSDGTPPPNLNNHRGTSHDLRLGTLKQPKQFCGPRAIMVMVRPINITDPSPELVSSNPTTQPRIKLLCRGSMTCLPKLWPRIVISSRSILGFFVCCQGSFC